MELRTLAGEGWAEERGSGGGGEAVERQGHSST
jgi:hypothetical protein